ncbi:MAG TPA: transglycosylase domain-containing protein, partial [candidate division Zixibacteria bacterium]|nr:transglycosylase domain-containing protein [candidate division Zixibacteria bacterium]
MPFRAPRRKVKLAAASLALALALLAALDRFVFPLPVERLSRPHARFVYSRDRVLLASFTSRDSFWRAPVPYNGLSPRLIESVLAVEDRWFRRHPGVNPVALLGAAWDNLRAGRVVRG